MTMTAPWARSAAADSSWGASAVKSVWVLFLGVVSALALGGCSGLRAIDNQVRSFQGPAGIVPIGAEVYVERLPSQSGTEFEPIVRALEQALLDRGLRPVTHDGAPWLLQTQWKMRAIEPPRALSPHRPFDTNMWFGSSGHGASFIFHFPVIEPVWTAFDLDLVLRHRTSQAVAFEAHVSHQGPWNDVPQLAPTLVNAAFQHYPQGNPKRHTVIEEIAR